MHLLSGRAGSWCCVGCLCLVFQACGGSSSDAGSGANGAAAGATNMDHGGAGQSGSSNGGGSAHAGAPVTEAGEGPGGDANGNSAGEGGAPPEAAGSANGGTGGGSAGSLSGTAGSGGSLGGTGGSSAGSGGQAGGGPLTYFDYYHDGAAIRWLNTSGSGKVIDLAGVAPQAVRFPEGDIDGTGLVTNRRASVVYLDSGKLYRLDASAYGSAPGQPVRLSTLSGITEICNYIIASDLHDRSQSRLIAQYETNKACSGGFNKVSPMAAIPLEGDASTQAAPLDTGVRPLLDPTGKILDVIQVTADQRLIRSTSLTNLTELAQLSGADVMYATALSLGGAHFLIDITRASDFKEELYTYDATSHTLSASLGKFNSYSYNLLGINHDDTYAFIVGELKNDSNYHLFRFPLSGSSAPVPLANLAPTGSSLSIVGIASGKLIYRQTNPLPDGVYSIPVNADFVTPPASTTILSGVYYPALLSDTRLFYQNGNVANVINLDATHQESYSTDGSLSHWVGCTKDPALDTPSSAQHSGNCDRVYLQALGASLKGAELKSFDTDADPGQGFFGSALRVPIDHGAFPNEYASNTLLVDASRSGSNAFMMPVYALGSGWSYLQPTLADAARTAIFSFKDPSLGASTLSFIAPSGSFMTWLSRGP